VFQIWQVPGAQWLWPALGLLGVWTLVETYVKMLAILRPWRIRFPSGIATVKDLCRAVLAANWSSHGPTLGSDTCEGQLDSTALPG